MTKLSKKSILGLLGVMLLILTAASLRFVRTEDHALALTASFARVMLYCALFFLWGGSVRRRIINARTRRYLTAVSALMLFWITERSVKYYFALNAELTRILWYLFYLPMIFIPLLGLFVALSLGKPEEHAPPAWTRLLLIPAALLFLLVMTNDLHHLVFRFSAPEPWGNGDYTYAPCYWAVIGFEIACAAAAIAIMVSKCHIPKSRRFVWLPLLPLIALLVYAALYVLKPGLLKLVAGDITVVFCLMYMAVFECCIRSGLIQSNAGYAELFRASNINARITDTDYNVRFSGAGETPDRELMRRTCSTSESVLLPGGVRLSGAPIRGGYVIWQDDVSALTDIIERLRDVNESLSFNNVTLREEYDTNRRRLHLTESNRIYDLMQKETASRLKTLEDCLDTLYMAQSGGEERRSLAMLAVVGAYIKRRNNLLFISESERTVLPAELERCFSESMDYLGMLGIEHGYTVMPLDSMPFSDAVALYDTFESVLEAALCSLNTLYAAVGRGDGAYTLTMELNCTDEPDFAPGLSYEREEDGCYLVSFRTGGEGGAQ